jgi:hypothetical protein
MKDSAELENKNMKYEIKKLLTAYLAAEFESDSDFSQFLDQLERVLAFVEDKH